MPAPIPPVLSPSALRKRLSDGAHPQDLLAEVVEASISGEDTYHAMIVDCIALLSKSGARVATSEPGCALEDIILKPACPNPGLIVDILHRIVDQPGELPFHVIAKHFPILLSYNRLVNPDLQASLLARDPDGRTVSHCLWDPQSTLVAHRKAVIAEGGALICSPYHKEEWLRSVRLVWDAQGLLHELGFTMESPDNQGRTALDLCVDRLEAEDINLSSQLDVCKHVQAHQTRRTMGTDTPLVNVPPPPAAFRF